MAPADAPPVPLILYRRPISQVASGQSTPDVMPPFLMRSHSCVSGLG